MQLPNPILNTSFLALYTSGLVLSINKYLYNCRFYAIKFYKIQQCSIGKSDQRACLLYADRDACARHFPIQRSAAIYYVLFPLP